jgi:hypothetical protein
MILVILTLTQDFVGHGSKVISQSVYNFRVISELKPSEISHINKDVVVYLDPKVAALLNVNL